MSATPSAAAPLNRGMITISVMLATVMQVVDTTIVNVALPHMQGSMSATQDQISWVLTSYIVAAAIMTPLTGVLADRMGRRRLFGAAVIGFTLASMLCGAATSLTQLVVFRALQGALGASLVPLSQAVLLDTYPKEKHGSAMALWGMGVMVGPILGPTLGGYLTEYYSWRWAFYINLPVGILALLGIAAFVPEGAKSPKRGFDFFGFALLSISIGALQLMLDRGNALDWFDSAEVVLEAATAALAFYLFMVHMFTADKPFIEPGLFADRNFVAGVLLMFTVGVLLLATMALLPPFLQSLLGFPVITAGYVLAPRGVGTMLAMMIVGRIVGKVDIAPARADGAHADGLVAARDDAVEHRRRHARDHLDGRRARHRARLHLRAAVDDRVRDAGAALSQRRHGDVQPDPQHRQQRRHFARHDRARARERNRATRRSARTSARSATRSRLPACRSCGTGRRRSGASRSTPRSRGKR